MIFTFGDNPNAGAILASRDTGLRCKRLNIDAGWSLAPWSWHARILMGDAHVVPCETVGLEDVEILDSLTSARLPHLARARETGELVCSCDRGEAHVYLQRGRVAWANDCRHLHAFTGHLKQHARLDTPTVEAVVAQCRATKRPIGETLVEQKLATEAQVRAALRHQIRLALHIGECRGEGGNVFLRRNYDEYDERFTFRPSELISDGSQRPGESARDG